MRLRSRKRYSPPTPTLRRCESATSCSYSANTCAFGRYGTIELMRSRAEVYSIGGSAGLIACGESGLAGAAVSFDVPDADLGAHHVVDRALDPHVATLARAAGHQVLAANRLAGDERLGVELVDRLAARLDAAAAPRGRRVVEVPVDPRGVDADDEPLVLVPDLDALGVAAAEALLVGGGVLADEEGLLAELHRGVRAAHLERAERVVVAHRVRADLEPLGELVLAVGAVGPERRAALVELVGDADRDRVQVDVEARDRRLEQDPPGERLDLVVAEPRLRLDLQDQPGLVAVAREDLDLLAVDDRAAGVELERARGAVRRELLDDLPRGVVARRTR